MSKLDDKHKAIYSTTFKRMDSTEEEPSRTFQFIISTESKDRHGTIIKSDGWDLKNFNANPIVAFMHNTSNDWWSGTSLDPDDLLGPGRAWVEDGKLMGEVTFEDKETNPKADKIMRKVLNGTLKATSVGFRPIDGHWGEEKNNENPDTYYYDKSELLEFSIVAIPSNPDALMRSYESELRKMLPEKPTEKKKQINNSLIKAKNQNRRNKIFINSLNNFKDA